MAFKTTKTALVAVGLISLLGSCSSFSKGGKVKVMAGTWQATPIEIDGDSKDWPSPYPNYDAKAMVAYATSNDDKNLYITMETGDPLTQVKILKQGMTVSIDVHGKKDPTYHINFPLADADDVSDLFNQSSDAKDGSLRLSRRVEQKLAKAADECNQMSLEGFNGCSGGFMIAQDNPCGIKVKVRIDEYKQLVWEAVVPFSAISSKSTITAAEAGKPVGVCFSVKAFKSKSKSDNAASMPVNNNMGSSGMGGSGMNSMPMGGGGAGRTAAANPMQHLYESTKTWKHFYIAWK